MKLCFWSRHQSHTRRAARTVQGNMSNYSLNFAPITLTGQTTVFAGTQSYNKEALRELRREYRTTHIFQRRGRDDVIVDIPIAAGVKPLGNLGEEVDLAKAKEFLPQLIS